MKTTRISLKQNIRDRKIKLPTKLTAFLLRLIIKTQMSGKPEYEYKFDQKQLKNKQVVLLADHSSRDNYLYVINGYKLANVNAVVGTHNFYDKFSYGFLLKAGAIAKNLYEPDVKAAMNMISVVKMGGSLCLFPEGIQSSSGSNHPINPATAKFLKKAGITVVLCKSYGAYLSNPRYTRETFKGKRKYVYEVLFTPEELNELSPEQIYDKLFEHFKYNDFIWNKDHGYEYYSKNGSITKGIENLLYICPKCKSEFTVKETDGTVFCSECGNTVKVTPSYEFEVDGDNYMPFDSIDAWYKWQRKVVKEQIKGDNYQECYPVSVNTLRDDKLTDDKYVNLGKGILTINNKGIKYEGTFNGEQTEMFFDAKKTPSFSFTPGIDNDLYYNGFYYNFVPLNDKQKVVKYMLMVEEAHVLAGGSFKEVNIDTYGK